MRSEHFHPGPAARDRTRNRFHRCWRLAALLCLAPLMATAQPEAVDIALLQSQVDATERAFARSMAERDIGAFAAHLAPEAVFFAPNSVLNGREAVLDGWRQFFDGSQAPFSWEPDQVVVLASGDLAHSSGPVRDPSGAVVSRFNSIWRRDTDGVWRIVFDRGDPRCRCDHSEPAATGDG